MSWSRQLKSLTKLSTLKVQYLSSLSALTGHGSLDLHDSRGFCNETRWLSVLQSLTHLHMGNCPDLECAEALSGLKSLQLNAILRMEGNVKANDGLANSWQITPIYGLQSNESIGVCSRSHSVVKACFSLRNARSTYCH